MATEKSTKKAKKVEYLYGTFSGKGKISINKNTDPKKIEKFLKENPSLKSYITDKDKIKNQRLLINGK